MAPRAAGLARLGALVLAGCALLAPSGSSTKPSQSNALWHVIHDLCVPDKKTTGLAAPCVAVDLTGRYAVLKDLRGKTQLLLIPTDRITGIESPKLLENDGPNFWQDAWDARPLFDKGAGTAVPRDDVGLAINSVFGRTQNQLHIHIDCVRQSVRDAIAADQDHIGLKWTVFPTPFNGHVYRVRRLMGEDLGGRDPFKLLAADPHARADMGRQTLAVIGATFKADKPDAKDRPGFVLLADAANLIRYDQGAAEELLDHECRVLTPAP
jgi:CDP-diacylglycerol pyrophosphatase